MADNTYQIGDAVPLEATFRNTAGTLTNPTAVTLTIRAPDGTVTTPTPTNPSTGVYHYDLSVTLPGLWWYTFKGTGAVQAADRNSFYVENDWITSAGPLAPNALVTLEEAREYVLQSVTDDSQDHKLVRGINTFSTAAAAYTRREWLPQSSGATRRFIYRGAGPLPLIPYDLRAATSIVAFTDYPTNYQVTLTVGTSTVVGEWRLRPTGADPLTGTYRWIDFDPTQWNPSWYRGFEISVTGDWGICSSAQAVPWDVKEAVLVAVADNARNPEGAANRSFGALTVTEDYETTAEGMRWRALPGESRALLTPYLDDVGTIVA